MRTTLLLNVDVTSTANPGSMSIGETARRFGLAPHVLRHWESVGLLSPSRAVAGRRRYGPDHLYQIAVILRAKEAGIALDDIRQMFVAQNPTQRTATLRRHRAELAKRIAQAQASLELIDCALACEHDDITGCPHFQAMVAERFGLDPPV
ncbi:helix-turn-helix domain-containing protein [Micromonospora sp. WMMC250]|uniref:helix-turn-helix domain-containing protein n=1 Tax=Micromonospora sp. WMMC250 TaxID=3014781 RepID=UPI0022B729E6|nr:MerR family transcriptional regulator [Micromonospora sp. WMMC250]MCZ7379890.1 MerR family transcriptional regulator [Micromonospora sp. WMMC250]